MVIPSHFLKPNKKFKKIGGEIMSCGIYKITNLINGHMYIGMSKDIEKRFSDHKTKAIHSKRKDDLDKVLYKAIRKYGAENFSFEIIEECDENLLKEREIYWIKYYNTYEDRQHYNETPGGDIPGYNTVHIGEEHGMAILTEKDVLFCRECYEKGLRSRDIFNEHYLDCGITWSGFLRMWHGKTWKHVKPEVFKNKPHRRKYTQQDQEIISALFEESGLNLHQFSKTDECYVGYGTLYKMIHEPEFYQGK